MSSEAVQLTMADVRPIQTNSGVIHKVLLGRILHEVASTRYYAALTLISLSSALGFGVYAIFTPSEYADFRIFAGAISVAALIWLARVSKRYFQYRRLVVAEAIGLATPEALGTLVAPAESFSQEMALEATGFSILGETMWSFESTASTSVRSKNKELNEPLCMRIDRRGRVWAGRTYRWVR